MMKSRNIMIVMGLSGLASQAAVVSHYTFDVDLTDSSGNGNDGTLTDIGTTGNSLITNTAGSHVFGGGAMDFSDDRDFVAIPSQTFGSGTPYTISFWAQKDDASRNWNMAVGDRNNNNFFIAVRGDADNIVRWRSSSSATARQQDFVAASDAAWHHYAIVGGGTDIEFYFDGALVNTGTGKQTGFIINTIGEAYTNAADFDFQGRMDEVWILDEAADAATISNLFNTNSLTGVPEPGSVMLCALGALFLGRRKRG